MLVGSKILTILYVDILPENWGLSFSCSMLFGQDLRAQNYRTFEVKFFATIKVVSAIYRVIKNNAS